jgi:homoserine dehydrogenase
MGKHVVTANKAAVAASWNELSPFLSEPHRKLWYGASVGGAVPMLETLVPLQGRVREVRGVINGTCNSVLDALEHGVSYDEAVRRAQSAGFAEADPGRDLSGADSADKLSLIVQAAFGVHVPPGEICTRGIEGPLIANATHVWRLIARAAKSHDALTFSVSPEQGPRDSFLGETVGAENRLEIVLEDGAIVRLAGQGAGRWPTTTAVMGDVHEVVRRCARAIAGE